MSPEGLNQRFNKTAVAFLQAVFTSLLTQKLCSSQSLSPQTMSLFKRIRILDATVFQLPDAFSSEYPGSGGSCNTAGVKIQLEYDVLSGQFLHVQVGPEIVTIRPMVRLALKPWKAEIYAYVI